MSVLSLVFFFLTLDFVFHLFFYSVQCMEQYKGPPGLDFFVDFLGSDGNEYGLLEV